MQRLSLGFLGIMATVAACTSSASDPSEGSADAGPGDGALADAASESPRPTALPKALGTCPEMANLSGTAATFSGQAATVWSGDPAAGPGPLLIYYYATGSSPDEVRATIGGAQIDAFTSKGGAIVLQQKTTGKGATTGNDVWYTGDAEIADEIVACAIEKQRIDPRRIHVAGYSAGALQTVYMWFARSGYVASVLSYSGGEVGINVAPMQDASHPPAALVAHGAKGLDTYGGIVDFFDTSSTWLTTIAKARGFAIDCNDGGKHGDYVLRSKIAPLAVQFFFDHPYAVSPEPYSTLPSGFPDYCKASAP